MALLGYPTLQAADILLYDADEVPVGEDQTQHLELARDLAIRFNNVYGETFVVPKLVVPAAAGRVMDLTKPTQKMSKSASSVQGAILLDDSPDVMVRKIRRAVTDGGRVVKPGETGPGVRNLIELYAGVTGCDVETVEDRFAGRSYGQLKERTAEAVVIALAPIGRRLAELRDERSYVTDVLRSGTQKAFERSAHRLEAACDAIGFLPIDLRVVA